MRDRCKRWARNALGKKGTQRILGWLASVYLRFVFRTNRWVSEGQEHLGPGAIIVFWHEHMAMASFAWKRGLPFFMLISPNADGRIIAHTVRHLGIESISGTGSKHGRPNLLLLLRRLKDGLNVGLTPDGPQGPRHCVHEGVFNLALLSQCRVIPFSYALTRKRRLSSWDRFLVPYPFGRGALVVGTPIPPPSGTSEKDAFLTAVRDALIAATTRAETIVHRHAEYHKHQA